MLRFGKKKVAKENFYGAKTSSKYFIRHLDKVIRPLVLILPKMSGYVKILKTWKDWGLKKSWIKCFLRVYDDRFIKTKIRTYVDKNYTSFRGVNVLGDDIECESFAVISIDSLLVYESNCYLQVYLDNYASKIVEKQMIDYFGENLFETGQD